MLNKMTNEEINKEKDKMFAQIKSANERLTEIRKICKHEKTFIGNYSWRVGSIEPSEICTYCGEWIIGGPMIVTNEKGEVVENTPIEIIDLPIK